MPGDQPPFPQPDGLPGMTPKKRGTANDIMGSIFDALAAVGGGTPTYWSNVLEGQQRDDQGRQRLAERQAERQAMMQQWIAQQDYKRQNPDPTGMESDLAAFNRMTPDQRAQLAAMYDIKSPIAVSGPQGTYRVGRTVGHPLRQWNGQAVVPGVGGLPRRGADIRPGRELSRRLRSATPQAVHLHQ